jgi:nitrite reductase/ring-hydroxylating ferredoxin subunit/putative sterol carrier protein
VGDRFPFPSYPQGWYVVAFSSELAPGEVKTVHYLGRDIVLFRSQAGVLTALDKTCPHLGAHLGGGRVDGECLRCPFHEWAFDGSGRCVDVPYAPKIPHGAAAKRWHSVEQNGVVMVYFDPRGEAPSWTPPELDEAGWTPNRTIRWEIDSHPQEVGENTVDCAHLKPIHHVISTEVKQVEKKAHTMRVLLGMVASGRIIGMPEEINEVELDVTLHGLGHIVSRTHVITAGLRTRQRIHPTPIDDGRIAIFAVGNTMEMPDPAYTADIDEIFWGAFTSDFPRDFPIWENKAYLERPLLAGGDGPIGTYRRWAKQFYAAAERPAAAPEVTLARGFVARLLDGVKRFVPLGEQRVVQDDTFGEWTGPAQKSEPGGQERKGQPRFESVDAYFQSLERRFNPDAAGELVAVFQWRLTGDRALTHFAEVREGKIQTAEGVHAEPTVTIEMSAEDYLRMINGDLNGAFAFSTGRGRLRGPVRLAMRMQQLFPLDRGH